MAPDSQAADLPAGFPPTRHSLVQRLGSDDPGERERAFGTLVEVYWRPAYGHLRLKWKLSREEAEDLTQEFFLEALSKESLAAYQPARARFRTFLRSCLDHFAANARRAERRLKRGGGARHLPLDFEGAEREVARFSTDGNADLEARFHQEWVRALFGNAVSALRDLAAKGGHAVRFTVFERYDLAAAAGGERPTYAMLGEDLGLPVTQVTNHLAWARREFRRLVLECLREISGSEAEFEAEARELLGVEK